MSAEPARRLRVVEGDAGEPTLPMPPPLDEIFDETPTEADWERGRAAIARIRQQRKDTPL